MNKSGNILNELQSISPEVARINGELPYEVPAGYFEGLAAQILERIKAEETSLPAVLQEVRVNPFTVPAGYFEQLPELVLQRVKAAEEVMPPVLAGASTNPYTVPAGYFEQLPDILLKRVKGEAATTVQDEIAALSPLLSGLSKKMPFHTPEGYFTDLTDNAVSGAKAIDFVNEELENLSPVMVSLKGKQAYEVPAGYFDQLPGQLLDKVRSIQQPAKVVSMSFTRKVMRYAAAAVLVGVVAMGAWWLIGNSDKPVTPDKFAQNDHEKPVAAPDVSKVSDDELQSYLEDETALQPTDMLAVNTKADIGANDMKDMLSDVSDEEIQKYLEQNTIVKLNRSSAN
jgi:hypothetical protein